VLSSPVQMNTDLSVTARALCFSRALSTKPAAYLASRLPLFKLQFSYFRAPGLSSSGPPRQCGPVYAQWAAHTVHAFCSDGAGRCFARVLPRRRAKHRRSSFTTAAAPTAAPAAIPRCSSFPCPTFFILDPFLQFLLFRHRRLRCLCHVLRFRLLLATDMRDETIGACRGKGESIVDSRSSIIKGV